MNGRFCRKKDENLTITDVGFHRVGGKPSTDWMVVIR